MADFSPVPRGVANSGDAVVYGPNNALRYLQRTDLLARQQQARAQAAAQKAQEAEMRDAASRLKLSDAAGVHYLPLLQAEANKTYKAHEALINDRSLTRAQRAIAQQELNDTYNRTAVASEKNDKYLMDLGQRVTADKRYDRDKTTSLLVNTLYKDGKQIAPIEYDPRSAQAALEQGDEHLNTPLLIKQYLQTEKPNAVSYLRQPLPGGRGYKSQASSDIYELNPATGEVVRDKKTGEKVLRATPATLADFRGDPLQRQWLDAQLARHNNLLTSATGKAQRNEELTPEESLAVEREKSNDGPSLEILKDAFAEHGYSRENHSLLNRPAPRPRAAGSGATKSVTTVGADYLPGTVIGGGPNSAGMVSYGVLPAATYGKPGTQPKRFVGKNVKHQEVVTVADDGSPVAATQTNQASGDVAYGQRHVLLRSSKTGNVFLGTPTAVDAAKRGDYSVLDSEARSFRAKHPEYKPEIYVEANSMGANGLQAGSKEEYFDQLKAQEDAFKKAYASGGLSELQKMQAEMGMASSTHVPRFRSEKELKEKADKEYAQVSKTHYVRYRGTDKIAIDQATGYAYRNKQQSKAMLDALDAADRRTRPGADEQRQVTAGRGPLAGVVLPTGPARAAAKPAAAPAVANPHGFKFKK